MPPKPLIPLAARRGPDGAPEWYMPEPYQMALHRRRGRARLRALIMGYGGGKTVFGCAELVTIALNWPGARILDVSPSYKMARKTTIETYKQMLEASGIRAPYIQAEHEFRFPNGSLIWIGSGDDPDSLKGSNITHARIDEPFIQDRAVYDQVIARLRLENGPLGLILTGTPEQLNWGYDLLFPSDARESAGGRAILQCASTLNKHNPQSYYDTLFENYDAQQIQAYIYGQFVSLSTNQAYYSFNPKLDIAPILYNPGKRIYLAIDFNVEPLTAALIQQDGETDLIFDEIHIAKNGTIDRLCAEFTARYPKHAAGVSFTGDPAGNSRDVRTSIGGYNNFMMIRDYLRAVPDLQDGSFTSAPPQRQSLNLTNSRFQNSRGARRMRIDPKCKWTIKDFERVLRTPEGDIDKKTDPGLTHHSDGIRYYHWRYRRNMAYTGVSG